MLEFITIIIGDLEGVPDSPSDQTEEGLVITLYELSSLPFH